MCASYPFHMISTSTYEYDSLYVIQYYKVSHDFAYETPYGVYLKEHSKHNIKSGILSELCW